MPALATAFVRIQSEATGFGKDLKKQLDASAAGANASGAKVGESFASGLTSKVSKVANVISKAMLGGAAIVGAASVDMAVRFDGVMERLVTQAGVAQKQIPILTKGIEQLAGQVGFSPDSLADSLYHIESNFQSLGISAPKALALVKIAAQGAAVGGANLTDVTNALTAAVASGIPGVHNISGAMGALNSIVGAGDMKMQDLAEAFSGGMVAVVKGFGLSLTDVGAALDVFGDNNIRGAKAGTQLRMSVMALAAPTAAGAKELVKLGISSGNLASALQKGGLLGALDLLMSKMRAAGYTSKTQGEFITSTFGKRAGAGLSVLLDQMDRLKSKYPDIAKGAKDFGKAWEDTLKTPAQQFRDLISGVEALGVKIGNVLLPYVMDLLHFIEAHYKVIGIMAASIGGLSLIISGVSMAMKVWTGITAVWAAVSSASLTETIALWVMYTFGVESAGVATVIATGGIILVVAALAVGIYEVIKHWRDFKQWGVDALHAVEDAAKDVFSWIHSNWHLLAAILFGPIGLAVDAIVTHWKAVSHAFEEAYDFFRDVWRDVEGFLAVPVKAAVDLITGYWDRILEPQITAVIRWIKAAWALAYQWLIKPGEQLITGLFNGALSIAKTAITWATRIGTIVVTAFKNFFGIHSPSAVFMSMGENLIGALGKGMLGGAKGLATWALKELKGLGSSLWDTVMGALGLRGGAPGPGGGQPASNARLAQSMMGPWSSGPEWQAWNNVAMAESGWNQYADNPGSGAYGIPQALPPTKMPKAAQASGGSNPRSQIGWMISYIQSTYGDPQNAWAHEQKYHWYGAGGVIPEQVMGVGLRSGRGYMFGERGPETVTPGAGGSSDGGLAVVAGLLQQLVAVTGGVGHDVAGALNGVARSAGTHAMYPNRMGGQPVSSGDSLILAEQIELLGAGGSAVDPFGTPMLNPLASGACCLLMAPPSALGGGYDLGAPQPTTDIVGSLLLDGERPFGYRSSNRTMTLPILIKAPTFQQLIAAREILMQEIDQQTWTMRWTRSITGPYAGNTITQPLLFDCFRAQPSIVSWGAFYNRVPYGILTLTFQALPYGRSDVATVVDFQSPLAGITAPPATVTLDDYTPVPAQWLSADASGFNSSLGGWTAYTNCTVARSTAQANSGPASMAMTSSAAGNMVAAGPGAAGGAAAIASGLPVNLGQAVSVSAFFRSAVSVRAVSVGAIFFDIHGNFIETAGMFFTANDSTSAWTQEPSQPNMPTYGPMQAPAAGYVVPLVQVQSTGAASEVHYVDDVILGYTWTPWALGPTQGGFGSALWDPTQIGYPTGVGQAAWWSNRTPGANLIPNGWCIENQAASTFGNNFQGYAVQPAGGQGSLTPAVTVGDQFQIASNWLQLAGSGSVKNSGFEGGIGTWAESASGNCAVADSAAQAHQGSDSMTMTSVAAGNMLAQHTAAANYATNGLAVTPGQRVICTGWFRSAVSARSCQVYVTFFDFAGNSLGSQFGPLVTDSTTGWVQAVDNGVLIAPAFAAWAICGAQVIGTGAASEVHYVDDVTMGVQSATIYTVTQIAPPVNFFGISAQIYYSPSTASLNYGDFLVQVGPTPTLAALTFYAGFGSNNYYNNWARLGGRVNFAFTVYDANGNVTSFSRTVKCTGGNSSSVPVWNRMRVPVPPVNAFNWSNIAAYTIKVTNRGTNDLRFTQLYLSTLLAVPAPTPVAALSRGVVYDLAGTIGSARAPISVQTQIPGTQSVTRTLRLQGGGLWVAPPGCTTVSVYAVGGGGGGGYTGSAAAGGGGGGGSALNAAVGVTAGLTYAYTVGVGGAGGISSHNLGGTGGSTTFTGDSVTVTAPGGVGAAGGSSTAAGAGGAAGTGGFAGASGGIGVTGTGAGGGGSSGGSASAGNAGSTGTTGAGGAAVAGGGAGGHGASTSYGQPQNGFQPGGGGGGGGQFFYTGAGGAGELILIYSQAPVMQSLILHKPPVTAPGMFCPFVTPGQADVPNGATEYPLPTLVPGVNARFGGTYTVVAAPYSWNTPANPRTLTVTIKEYEQAGGASYSSSVTCTFTPSALPQLTLPPAGTGYVIVGEITLPIQDLPQDNLNAYYSVLITDTNTSDRFMDVIFLDTMGSTVIIQSPTGYQNMFVDEPPSDRDLGLVMGSLFDRPDAVSILDRAIISGGPLFLDPNGNHSLLAYSMEGAPSLEMIYFPRWWMDRYQ